MDRHPGGLGSGSNWGALWKKKNQEFYLNYIACSKFYTLSNSHGSLSKRSWGILCSRNKTNWIKERRINACFLHGWNLIWGPQKKERIILTTLAKRTLQFLLINVGFFGQSHHLLLKSDTIAFFRNSKREFRDPHFHGLPKLALQFFSSLKTPKYFLKYSMWCLHKYACKIYASYKAWYKIKPSKTSPQLRTTTLPITWQLPVYSLSFLPLPSWRRSLWSWILPCVFLQQMDCIRSPIKVLPRPLAYNIIVPFHSDARLGHVTCFCT